MQPIAPALLAGRHVRLEPLALTHQAGLHRAATVAARESFIWTHVPADEEEARLYIEDALADQRAGRAVPFATCHAGEVVGTTRFGNIERWTWRRGSPEQRPADCADAVEIGWTWLTPAAQRTVVNTEAKRLMLAHAFEVWGVRRVTLKTDVRNLRSRSAIERLGAKLDGILRANQPAVDDQARNSAVYSIVASEWPDVRARLDKRLDQRLDQRLDRTRYSHH